MLRKIRIALATVMFIGITLLFLDFTGTMHHWVSWMPKIQFLEAVLALNVVVIVALLVLTLVFGWISYGFIRGLAWTLLLPCLVIFDCIYWKWGCDLFHDINYARAEKAGKTKAITDLRDKIRASLYKILIKKTDE